jgi:hypothetical protein
MGELVRDERHQGSIAGENRRRCESEARILHAAEGKRRRQHEQVVAIPAIRAVERFRRSHHLLGVGQFPGGCLDDRRLGVDAGSRTELAKLEIADGERQQIGRHWLVHAKPVDAVLPLLARVVGTHESEQAGVGAHGGGVGDPDSGRVLARHPGASEDRLRLSEEKRLLAARRLTGIEPLDRGRFRARCVLDADDPGLGTDRNGQAATEQRVVVAQPEFDRVLSVEAHGEDLEIAGVEDQLVARRLPSFDAQIDVPSQPMGLEIDGQVEIEIRDRHQIRSGERMGIARRLIGSERRGEDDKGGEDDGEAERTNHRSKSPGSPAGGVQRSGTASRAHQAASLMLGQIIPVGPRSGRTAGPIRRSSPRPCSRTPISRGSSRTLRASERPIGQSAGRLLPSAASDPGAERTIRLGRWPGLLQRSYLSRGSGRGECVSSSHSSGVLLGLGSLVNAGAWGDYATLSGVWILTFCAVAMARNRRRAVVLGTVAIFPFFVPGTMPIGDWYSLPTMLGLSLAGAIPVQAFYLWSLVGIEEGALDASPPVD